MNWVALIGYTIILGVISARVEIEIEGKDGWAAKLPTWRITEGWLARVYGKPITGYHVWTLLLWLGFFHQPVLWTGWSWRKEVVIIALYLIFINAGDLAWFLLNPDFGWKKFNRENIWWHKRWWLGLPIGYWLGWGLAGGLLLLAL